MNKHLVSKNFPRKSSFFNRVMMKLELLQLIALLALVGISCTNIINVAHHPNVIIMHVNNLVIENLFFCSSRVNSI